MTETVKHKIKKQEGEHIEVIMAPMTDALVAIMACSLIQPMASALTNVITGKGQEGRFFPLLRELFHIEIWKIGLMKLL